MRAFVEGCWGASPIKLHLPVCHKVHDMQMTKGLAELREGALSQMTRLNTIEYDWIRLTGSSKMLPGRWLNELALSETSLKVNANLVTTRKPLNLECLLVKLKPWNLKALATVIWLKSHCQAASGNLLSWKGTPEKRISQTWEAFWAL